MRRKPHKSTAQAELGKQWAEHHFIMPGRPEPLKVNNLDHDEACAERWNELTGKFPSWWTHLVERADGWWIINAEGAACDCGPYRTKGDAIESARGMRNFMKYHDKPGYITSEKKPRHKPTTEAGKKGGKPIRERKARKPRTKGR
jgi:hypothetical protein